MRKLMWIRLRSSTNLENGDKKTLFRKADNLGELYNEKNEYKVEWDWGEHHYYKFFSDGDHARKFYIGIDIAGEDSDE